ncbi:MAG: SpoIID/LytB domain-containing protein [Phycisphaeraceae bacterium]
MRQWLTTIALAGVMLGAAASCQPAAGPARGGAARLDRSTTLAGLPSAAAVTREPTMRVRIARHVDRVNLDAPGEVLVRSASTSAGAAASTLRLRPPATITHDGAQFIMRAGDGATHTWRLGGLRVTVVGGGPMTLAGRRYPDDLVLVALADADGRATRRFDVVNHVPMETYLPGVLERELFGNWTQQAFDAQAIAARSYALFERHLHGGRHYDIESTVASQAYGGAASNPRAIAAAQNTRGLVVHGDRVVPGFYSSACGGRTQTAVAAFTRFGNTLAIPPLRGGATCDHCQPSPNHRWGPVTRDARALADRIAAWGRANRDAVGELDGLASVRISHESRAGRPARFELTDRRGRRFALPAESFRFASNHAHARHGDVPREQQLRSSDVQVRQVGSQVRFHDGRGHGHGAGLCQWGAQGMARRGDDGQAIVRHYYPDAELRRLY